MSAASSVPVGQQKVIEFLYMTFRQRLIDHARHRAGPAAEDLVHEAFTRALSQDFEDADHGRRWLWVTVSHLAIDHHRRQHHRRRDVSLDHGSLGSQDDSVVGDHADASVNRLAIAAALERLPEAHRGMLWQRDGLGASIAEVAHLHGLTEASARVTLSRIRRQAAELLSTTLSALACLSATRRLLRWLSSQHPQNTTATAASTVVVAALLLAMTMSGPVLPADASAQEQAFIVPSGAADSAFVFLGRPDGDVSAMPAAPDAPPHGGQHRAGSLGNTPPPTLEIPTPLGGVRWHQTPPDQPPTGVMADIRVPVLGPQRTGVAVYSDRDAVPRHCTHLAVVPLAGQIDTHECEPTSLEESA